MNKILGSILVVSLLLITTSNVFAVAPVEGCVLKHDISIGDEVVTKTTDTSDPQLANWGMLCLLDAVYSVTDWIFYGLLALVSVFTVYGGFTIVTAGSDPEKVEQGRSFVVYATVGLVVAFLSRVIPSIAEGIVGA